MSLGECFMEHMVAYLTTEIYYECRMSSALSSIHFIVGLMIAKYKCDYKPDSVLCYSVPYKKTIFYQFSEMYLLPLKQKKK